MFRKLTNVCKPTFKRVMSTAQGAEPSLITEINKNGLLQITLNRPKAYNSLDLPICVEMNKLLSETINVKDTDVGAFLLKGAGEKAFCAGGDVKSLWMELTKSEKQDEIGIGKPGQLHTDFFRVEYMMNHMLAESEVPQVSFWDGVVMGGGVGISIFGEFRVATERALFAMPETAIGLFPDVGGSSWLPHLKIDGAGAYIGMTGVRLNPADLVHTDIATHFITSDKLKDVEDALKTLNIPRDPATSRKAVKDILDAVQIGCVRPSSGDSSLVKYAEAITRCFGKEAATSVENIIAKLEAETIEKEWAEKTLKTLKKMSPTSLKLTLEQLNLGKSLDLKGCLRMEYRMVQSCMRHKDFREGVRATLIEKDGKPQWNPATLEEVKDEHIQEYFAPLEEEEWEWSPMAKKQQ